MSELKNGVLKFEKLSVDKETTEKALSETFGMTLSYVSAGNPNLKSGKSDLTYTVYEVDELTLEGMSFSVRFTFANGSLCLVELMPTLPEIDKKYDLRGYAVEKWFKYVQELRGVVDGWLKAQLGKPSIKNREETIYLLSDVTIASQSKINTFFDGRMEVVGGQIDIHYNSALEIPFLCKESNPVEETASATESEGVGGEES